MKEVNKIMYIYMYVCMCVRVRVRVCACVCIPVQHKIICFFSAYVKTTEVYLWQKEEIISYFDYAFMISLSLI
jgi:hypothetical protein